MRHHFDDMGWPLSTVVTAPGRCALVQLAKCGSLHGGDLEQLRDLHSTLRRGRPVQVTAGQITQIVGSFILS